MNHTSITRCVQIGCMCSLHIAQKQQIGLRDLLKMYQAIKTKQTYFLLRRNVVCFVIKHKLILFNIRLLKILIKGLITIDVDI